MDKKKREILKMTKADVFFSKIRYKYYRIKEKIFFWRKYGPWEHWVWVCEKGKTSVYKNGTKCDKNFSCTQEYWLRKREDV